MNHMSDYINDNEDPIANFNLGLEYEEMGQGSAAITYFLRTAERTKDVILSYESLLHMGYLYDKQGKRERTVLSCWRKAIGMLPERPEAYYHASRLLNWNNEYDQGYLYASLALKFCDFNLTPLQNTSYLENNNYKECLQFEKGLSTWWWGKKDESKELLMDLYQNKKDMLPRYQKGLLDQYVNKHFIVKNEI